MGRDCFFRGGFFRIFSRVKTDDLSDLIARQLDLVDEWLVLCDEFLAHAERMQIGFYRHSELSTTFRRDAAGPLDR